jgi:hypothetical protein
MKGGLSQKKPVAAETAHGLQIIEQYGRSLGISEIAELRAWQASTRHTIYIESVGHKSWYLVRYRDEDDFESMLGCSRQPLLHIARLFLSLGANPRAIIAMRRRGKDRDDLFGPIAVAAKLTVDETKTIFAKWKPFPQSAGSPDSAPKPYSSPRVDPRSKASETSDRRSPNGNLIGSTRSSEDDES